MTAASAGFFSFTEITDPAEHRAYNEWHQLDHLPEQYSVPGIVLGQRWVLSPWCAAVRLAAEAPLSRVHYVTQYLLADPVDEVEAGFRALADRLHAEGRFHQHRRSHLSGAFDATGRVAAPRVLVSAEVVPFRPNLGAYVVVWAGGLRTGTHLATSLVEVDGVAGAWSFVRRSGPRLQAVVAYLDVNPVAVSGALDAVVVAFGQDSEDVGLRFAGPLESITPWQWDWFD